MLQPRDHGMAAAVLGQRQLGTAPAHFLRVHDLVGFAFLQDAVLVNARAVGEGVFPHDGLASRHMQPAHAADDTGGFQNLAGDTHRV